MTYTLISVSMNPSCFFIRNIKLFEIFEGVYLQVPYDIFKIMIILVEVTSLEVKNAKSRNVFCAFLFRYWGGSMGL